MFVLHTPLSQFEIDFPISQLHFLADLREWIELLIQAPQRSLFCASPARQSKTS